MTRASTHAYKHTIFFATQEHPRLEKELVRVVTGGQLLAGVESGGVLGARGLGADGDRRHAEAGGVRRGGSLANVLGGRVLGARRLGADGGVRHAEALGVGGSLQLANVLG